MEGKLRFTGRIHRQGGLMVFENSDPARQPSRFELPALAFVFALFVAMPWAVRPLERWLDPQRTALTGQIADGVLALILVVWVIALLQRVRRMSQTHAGELERVSETDLLTGLGNRRAFENELERMIHRARRTQEPVSILLFDVDEFEGLHRRCGRSVADHTLRMLGAVLRSSARFGIDAGFRIEKDEFALVVAAERDGAEVVSRRVEWNFRERSPQRSQLSAGIVTWNGRGRAEELLEQARRAMHAGRQSAALARMA
jgi:diguanylate cyclase (GGDEF)-like protein